MWEEVEVTRVEQVSEIGSSERLGELKDENNSMGYTERQTFLPKFWVDLARDSWDRGARSFG